MHPRAEGPCPYCTSWAYYYKEYGISGKQLKVAFVWIWTQASESASEKTHTERLSALCTTCKEIKCYYVRQFCLVNDAYCEVSWLLGDFVSAEETFLVKKIRLMITPWKTIYIIFDCTVIGTLVLVFTINANDFK